MTIIHGCYGPGENEHDFIAGSDFDVSKLKDLPVQDKKRVAVDQDYGDYTMACTMMSAYSTILSLFNMEEKEEEKKKIVEYAKTKGYVVGQGRLTRSGVRSACKVRNDLHPDKYVFYVRTELGSDQFKTAMEKGYGGVASYRTSYAYNVDKNKDGVVNLYSFKNFNGGHAISTYRSDDELNDWTHLNTYPKGKYNKYDVQNGYELVDSGTYRPAIYLILPDPEKIQNEIKKAKYIKYYMKIGSALWKLSESEETKKMLHESNEYFRSKGY